MIMVNGMICMREQLAYDGTVFAVHVCSDHFDVLSFFDRDFEKVAEQIISSSAWQNIHRLLGLKVENDEYIF